MGGPATTPSRRTAPRVGVSLPVSLARPHGNPVTGRTVDLSTGGARIACDRPLRVDEVLAFDLCSDGDRHLCGHCRVLREHAGQTYAVRFEHLDDDAVAEQLARMAAPRPTTG